MACPLRRPEELTNLQTKIRCATVSTPWRTDIPASECDSGRRTATGQPGPAAEHLPMLRFAFGPAPAKRSGQPRGPFVAS